MGEHVNEMDALQTVNGEREQQAPTQMQMQTQTQMQTKRGLRRRKDKKAGWT